MRKSTGDTIVRRRRLARTERFARQRAGGWTLIELLTVIGLIGLLISLAMPAVQAARESARRITCSNHLRQLGIGLNTYQATVGTYPYTYGGVYDDPPGVTHGVYFFSAQSQMLPYVGEENLYASLNFSRPYLLDSPLGVYATWPHEVNSTAAQQRVAVFLCPSDPYPGILGQPGNNYRTNMGVSLPRADGCLSELNGAFERKRALTPQEFTDGTSNTVAFSEKLKGSGDHYRFHPETDYFVSPFIWTNLDELITACGPLANPSPFEAELGYTWLLAGYRRTYYNHNVEPNGHVPDCTDTVCSGLSNPLHGSFAARSYHRGGVNCAMTDGSVRFVNENISLSVWRALGTRNGGESVTNAEY